MHRESRTQGLTKVPHTNSALIAAPPPTDRHQDTVHVDGIEMKTEKPKPESRIRGGVPELPTLYIALRRQGMLGMLGKALSRSF